MTHALENLSSLANKFYNSVKTELIALKVSYELIIDVTFDAILPFQIYIIPITESKAWLLVLADYEGEYRYTKATAESNAIDAFGFTKPNKSKLDDMV